MRFALAACGLEGEAGAPATRISPETPREHAEQSQQQFALSLPVETAEADHFAGVGGERDVAQPVRPAEVADFEQRRRGFRTRSGLGRKDVTVFTSDHHFDDLVVGLRSGRDRSRH